ncbi:uncharacterized protein LOC112092530 isoform X2 [Morus notabilis]|uniref:uncharacterized protein LOC112092530 isoform X2 n=1 Tax=Morus notabilis TaxID=981085 RepID=UPI000CED5539|nr:uncharacterized protein LOC112092530 isoform X2 [Morus notabilis]
MPGSGNEEMEVKPIVRLSSNYPAGIPIKKRRFPLIRPPSPPAEEPSPVESNSLQKGQSSPSQGSTLSYSSVGTSSSSLSDAVKNPEPEERKESSCVANDDVVRGNNNFTKVKVEEPSLTVHPSYLENVNGKEKLVVSKIPVNQMTGKNELNFSPTESLGLLGMNMVKQSAHVKVDAEAEASALRENTESLLSLKEPFVPVLSSHNRIDQNQETLEPISLNLSSSKESSSSSSRCKSDAVDKLNDGNSTLRADRANWDLNTPMDAWEGSSDVAVGQTLVDGMDAAGQTKVIKPSSGVSVASEKCSNTESENLTNLCMSSRLSSDQFKFDDSLHLRLSSCLRYTYKEPSISTLKLDSPKVIPNISLSGVVLPSSNLNKVNVTTVKSEPVEESTKLDTGGAKPSNVAILNSTAVKREFDPRTIKSEPATEGNKETMNSKEGTSVQLNEKMVGLQQSSATTMSKTEEITCPIGSSFSAEYKNSSAAVTCKAADTACLVGNSSSTESNHSSAASTFKTAEIACPGINSSLSTELAGNGDPLNSGRFSCANEGRSEVQQEACESSRQVAPDMGATLTSAGSKVDSGRAENSNTDDAGVCKSKCMNDLPLHSRGNGESAVSDEEKVNISADIEVSYSSDYESDGNHAIDMSIDMEIDSEDDYEDGEVREKLERTVVKESACEKGQVEHTDNSGVNNGEMLSAGLNNNTDPNSSHVEVKDAKIDAAEIDKKGGEEAFDAVHTDKCENESDKTVCLQESSTIENALGGAFINEMNKAMLRRPLDQSGQRGVQESQYTDSVKAANGGEETLQTISLGTTLSMSKDDLLLRNDTAMVKFADGDNAARDIDSGSHRSRIINLPRSSGLSSPGRTRTFSGGDRQWSRVGRERLPYMALEGDKIYSRGREDFYVDGAQKFSRERHYDQTARNSRMNFQRGRDFEYNTYNVSQDLAFVGSGRGGRKPLNDGGPFVRRIPSRRRSPGVARGIHMVRRISRNISPNRCVGEDGPELGRLKRNEKFVRGFPDDTIDSMFPRPQPQYEGVDGHFAQGNRNFPSVQRRVRQRIRSKSPLNSRTRSPGSWSSPRRRSPEGFAGHPDLTHRRSPQFYRVNRMRSPDRRCFAGEVVRRPDLRDMDSGRDHGHPGSVMPNRNPSDRIVLRDRRFGGLDPQERSEGDNFFGGPMHPGRLQELGGDVSGDERRFGERRGPVRPYRNNFNGADGENSHVNPEEGSRPLRFCPDDDAEFPERGNLTERDFHRSIKNRPGTAPRRIRNMEEQEGNYRHGGQVWHNNDFDDISRVRRKRF